MKLIQFPPPPDLGPHSSHDDIVNLQEALLFLISKGCFALPAPLMQGLISDSQAGAFTIGTMNAVANIRSQLGLGGGEIVDQNTAQALNKLLQEKGAFDVPEGAKPEVVCTYVVTGQVRREDGQPMVGASVRASHQAAEGALIRLGEDSTGRDGRYTIRYDLLPGVDAISLCVDVLNAAGNSLQQSPAIQGAKSLETVDLTVPGTDAPSYNVTGKISSQVSVGLGGLRVLVVDKGVGGDLTLKETTTEDSGNYTASFMDADFGARGKAQPDVQIRVFSGEALLGSSEVHYNASRQETIDVVLDDAAVSSLKSEHETLTGALAKHFNGSLADLKEDDNQQDITYLANKSGWDARAVALAALAGQFSAKTVDDNGAAAVQPEHFYALFRAGLPANEDTLFHTDAGTLTSVWQQAAEGGVISKAAVDQIPALLDSFQALSAQKMLLAPAQVGTSSLNEMLTTSLLNEDQKSTFAKLYAANRSDTGAFWQAVTDSLGQDTADRLQLDGKLGFLTINNAGLMQKVHENIGVEAFSDPLQLAQAGYHDRAKWNDLLTDEIPIPKEIPGDSALAQKANYAAYLAAQVRLSYPTASVAQRIKSGALPLTGAPDGAADQVHAFLTENQGSFEIGIHPVQQYVVKNEVQVDEATLQQVKRLQRVYQITPSDQAMTGLMRRGIDSAYSVTRYDREVFIQDFTGDVGSAEDAALVYDQSVQVHNAVLHVALDYLNARTAPSIGVHSPPSVIDPVPANPGDVIAYANLESLFGSMDFCDCEHCRSILSPAAYLVDLLLFLQSDDDVFTSFLSTWKKNHNSARYPFANPVAQQAFETQWDKEHPGEQRPNTEISPFAVLMSRRPDIENLALTCENTNTALPYIDIINEILEYYIANEIRPLSLVDPTPAGKDYLGHDTGEVSSEDLLASPQYVLDSAYTLLSAESFPPPLPFHRSLEFLRRYFNQFGAPLPRAMEQLRVNETMERGANAYGWNDILMEEVGLSRAEFEILTDSAAAPLWKLYGFPKDTPDTDVIAGIPGFTGLSNAKQLARRLFISYTDLVSLLRVKFINPNSDLIPKLERLGASFATLADLKNNNDAATDASFDQLLANLAVPPDPNQYDPDIKKWVKQPENFDRIMSIITLADPSGSSDLCSFDTLEFRYSKPSAGVEDLSNRLAAADFTRLIRFIRVWKKLGWTIDQTDAALCALFRADLAPVEAGDLATTAALDAGFRILIPRLGILRQAMGALHLTAKRDLLPLLTLWSEIGTNGDSALYRQMFLNPAILSQDSAFADNGYGKFVQNLPDLLLHEAALRAAFQLSGDEFHQTITSLGYDAGTALTLPNVSAIYRRGWLARKLNLSVRELLLLVQLTGLDPFTLPDTSQADFTRPALLRLVDLVQALKDRSLTTSTALYLIWNQDLSGKSMPDPAQLREFGRSLRADFAAIDAQFTAPADPNTDVARDRMAQVYGQESSDAFFALLDDTQTVSTPYTHNANELELAIQAADGAIAYDRFRHQLSHTGLMTAPLQAALIAVNGVSNDFKSAVALLLAKSEEVKGLFFTRCPELLAVYQSASAQPAANRHTAFLASFQPELLRKRKALQAVQRFSTQAGVALDFARTLLDAPAAPYPLSSARDANQTALQDVIAYESAGLTAHFFFRATATGNVDLTDPNVSSLNYAKGSANPLPDAGNAISAIWSGQIEAPEAGFYNFILQADSGAVVSLSVGGKDCLAVQNGDIWRNSSAIELAAGTLYDLTLTVENVQTLVNLKWETPKRARELVPARFLYSTTALLPFTDLYLRFLKATSLATGLGLTSAELAYFAAHEDYRINAQGKLDSAGAGWLNLLPAADTLNLADAGQAAIAQDFNVSLLTPLLDLLDYARIKSGVSPKSESLLAVFKDPAAATTQADSLLFTLTRWSQASLNTVLGQLGYLTADLTHLAKFRRVSDAFALIQPMGISAQALIHATTNEPVSATVQDLQAALRARYDPASWRDFVQPINDEMRSLQRDALVTYILQKMRSNSDSQHIDTPDKLFEYFLMDVQMDPCMQTSRIRHALSSVQTFIERCLMNLEPRVSAEAIHPDEWEWMKRYRVWEANRKVFLWPENWAEPELRDDKSPFFKEIESELLQSDITEETAATALLNYLAKLEEVAKLEPCGLFNDPGDNTRPEINHVIARTAGAHRKYYYRRSEAGAWLPWEQIKLDIEDNPVVPMVWNNRLLLFWLRVIPKGPAAVARPSQGKDVVKLNTNDLPNDPTTNISLVLCWSEYYNNKWQPMKTSDVSRPLTLGSWLTQIAKSNGVITNVPKYIRLDTDFATGEFDRTQLSLLAMPLGDGLVVRALGGGQGSASFFLFNTHSQPLLETDAGFPHISPIFKHRDLSTSGNAFNIQYKYGLGGKSLPRSVLQNEVPDSFVESLSLDLSNFERPFFYSDGRHVFYVISQEATVPLSDQTGYGVSTSPKVTFRAKIPQLKAHVNPGDPVMKGLAGIVDPVESDPSAIDPGMARRLVTEDAYIHQSILSTATVSFNNREIGLNGSLFNARNGK